MWPSRTHLLQHSADALTVSTAELVAANIRYRSTSGPLLHRAYAHVVCKYLLSTDGQGQTLSDIRQGCRDLVVRGRPTNRQVEAALNLLREKGTVEFEKGRRHDRWKLTSGAQEELQTQIEARRAAIEAAVERHFPTTAGVAHIREWLDAVAAQIFATYGDRWVRQVTGRPDPGKRAWGVPQQDLGEMAREIAREQGLATIADSLADGLWALLTSSDPDDRRLLWDYGRAMFAARLMAADLSADPITTARLRGGVLLLDTNAMISFALGAAAGETAFIALSNALEGADIEVCYLPHTLREYENVCDRRRDEVRRAQTGVSLYVLQQSTDEWIMSGLQSDAFRRGGWDGFFDELRDPTNEFAAGVRAEIVEDSGILEAARRGHNDSDVIEIVQKAWQHGTRSGRRPKSDTVARHDAALIAAAEHVRHSGRPVVVISTDSTLLRLAADTAGPNGVPLWTSPEALLQIFAAETESGAAAATDFAPLLSRLIAREVYQSAGLAYEIEDLGYLAELEADVADLPPEDVQSIARKLHRLVYEGRSREDPEIRRIIRNDVVRRRSELGHDLEAARASAAEMEARLRDAERRANEADRKHTRLAEAEEDAIRLLITERAGTIRTRSQEISVVFGTLGILGSLILIYIGVALFLAVRGTPDGATLIDQISTGTALLGALSLFLPGLLWPAKVFWNRAANAESVAKQQLRNEGKLR